MDSARVCPWRDVLLVAELEEHCWVFEMDHATQGGTAASITPRVRSSALSSRPCAHNSANTSTMVLAARWSFSAKPSTTFIGKLQAQTRGAIGIGEVAAAPSIYWEFVEKLTLLDICQQDKVGLNR